MQPLPYCHIVNVHFPASQIVSIFSQHRTKHFSFFGSGVANAFHSVDVNTPAHISKLMQIMTSMLKTWAHQPHNEGYQTRPAMRRHEKMWIWFPSTSPNLKLGPNVWIRLLSQTSWFAWCSGQWNRALQCSFRMNDKITTKHNYFSKWSNFHFR